MNTRGRVRRTPVLKPAPEQIMLQGELAPSDAFAIAQLALTRMFNKTTSSPGKQMELNNVSIFHVQQLAHQPERLRPVHSKLLEAHFSAAEVSEATIDTGRFPYGSVSVLGSLALDSHPHGWNDAVARMSFDAFAEQLGDIELDAHMNSKGQFTFRSYLDIVEPS